MKKECISLVLVFALLMALTACSSSSDSATTAADTEATTEADSSSNESTEADTSAAASGDAVVLRWSEVNGEDYGASVAAQTFKETVEELSGGQITIELYFNGTLGSEAESMQGIQMGTLDIFRGNASSLSNYGAEKISMTGLPFMFEDMDQFETMANSDFGQELLDSVDEADCGYVALEWLTEGPRSLFITEDTYNALGSPEEFSLDMMSGLKIRVPETDLMVNTMSALGASATPIAYSELYTSLQSGVVDGAENDVINYMANSYDEVAPYFIPDAHTFGCGVILMNKDKWNSLTEEQQGWMMEAAHAAGDTCYEYNTQKNQENYDSFEENGVTLLPVSDLAGWSAACESVYASYSEDLQDTIQRLRDADY